MKASLAFIATSGALFSAGMAVTGAADSTSPQGSVTIREAEEAFDDLVVAADEVKSPGDLSQFCAEYADDQGMCALSAESTTEAGMPQVPSGTPQITVHDLGETILVLTAGRLSDGLPYAGLVEIVRTSDGKVGAVDPVYWADRVYAGDVAETSPE